MALWGNLDQANNAPKFKGVLAGPVNYDRNYNHAGPASKVVFPSGAGYNNTDILVVNAGTSTTYSNATYALSTNATGYIQSVGKITPGSFSSNTVAGVLGFAITNSTYGTASGNTTVTGFTATVDQRVSGAELYGNATPGAFINGVAFGVFGVSANEVSNTSYSRKIQQGWVLRKVGEGPVTSITATGGVAFANGETASLSNGSVTGTLVMVTNATSNLVSATIASGGLFDVNTSVVVTFNREKHLSNFVITSNATAVGFSNGDIITGSNGSVNATATITTNATGGITSTTVTNVGLFGNTEANGQVVVTVTNATGGATWTALTSNGNVNNGNNSGWIFSYGALWGGFFAFFDY